jgi:hypothetical protein
MSVLRNISNENRRFLNFRHKIAIFQHRRTFANIAKVPALMWMSGETFKFKPQVQNILNTSEIAKSNNLAT